jgi:hypothetical protein
MWVEGTYLLAMVHKPADADLDHYVFGNSWLSEQAL